MSDATPRPPCRIRATWAGAYLFDAGRTDGPAARIDGSGETAQTPPEALLSALATCAGVDVLDILAKRRTPVEALTVDVEAMRRTEPPRRFVRIALTFTVDGAGIERIHAERAVRLAFEKYCSVAASLAPDIVAEARVTLNGAEGEFLPQPIYEP